MSNSDLVHVREGLVCVAGALFYYYTGADGGRVIAHSMALLADCVSMALDTVTYAINLAAECKEEPNVTDCAPQPAHRIGCFRGAGWDQHILLLRRFGRQRQRVDRGWHSPLAVLCYTVSLVPYFVYSLSKQMTRALRQRR
eukprot:TRINITY_DN6916_c0_g3_i1.p1 TRINITY_DN6916_c0_g3~~TRINITY_DN6916_c0_g3_i1.p1  ORF type:complete len:141 (+),score=2.34 TRINITY_DN6916_c0_g3_i1:98-520(+)